MPGPSLLHEGPGMVPHPHGSLPGLKASGEVPHIQGQGIPEHSSCTSVLLSSLEEGLLSETSLFPGGRREGTDSFSGT